jgi:hypothetical protein
MYATYLNEIEARSRAAGYFFMSSQPKNGDQQHNLFNNYPVASATED